MCELAVDLLAGRGRHTMCSRDWSSDVFFFLSSRRRHTRCYRDWSSDVCSSDLHPQAELLHPLRDEGQLPIDLADDLRVAVGLDEMGPEQVEHAPVTFGKVHPAP